MSKSLDRRRRHGRRLPTTGTLLRWLFLPTIGGVFVCGAAWAVAGILAADTFHASGKTTRYLASDDGQRVLVASTGTLPQGLAAYGRTSMGAEEARPVQAAAEAARRKALRTLSARMRFERAVGHADLSSEKLAALFGGETVAGKAATIAAPAVTAPAPERFAGSVPANAPVLLAFADPSPNAAGGALDALAALPPSDEGSEILADGPIIGDESAAIDPDFMETPDATPVPLGKPRIAARPRETEAARPRETDAAKPSERTEAPARPARPDRPERSERGTQLAFAKPNDPSGDRSGAGNVFRKFFNTPKAGNGVAVYDISAAKVYMPDGTVLEAHSGIGHMADNPKYAHVKMKGPTPPHTYNLRMREKRFHGVEAIRMLPVDGKNKHGRDGFLTHSYLLRGGRAESHGCVAFKDYKKFLTAFKQGKVTQMIVVPGGGAAIARARVKDIDA